MNTNHYPSLELCKKLTEIWFPTTFKHIWDSLWTVIWCLEVPEWMYVCPSVMEMLDVMPNRVEIKHWGIEWYVTLADSEWWFFDESLPDAIAEMYIWLHENNYLNFNK